MNKSSNGPFFFVAVLAVHLSLVAYILWSPAAQNDVVSLPSIQGVLLTTPPTETVALPIKKFKPAPEKEKKELKPKEKMPLPPIKSERAITVKKEKPIEKNDDERKKLAKAQTKEIPKNLPKEKVQKTSPESFITKETKDIKTTGTPITPPQIDANPLNNPAPAYPKLSRRLGEQGIVLLEILISPNGTVSKVRLKKSSGFPRLDKTAMRAIKQWRYQPARQGSKAIEYWYLQPLEFSLNNVRK